MSGDAWNAPLLVLVTGLLLLLWPCGTELLDTYEDTKKKKKKKFLFFIFFFFFSL